MTPRNPYEKYRNTQITTASPARLVLLLYEGALKHLCIGERNIADPGGFTEASMSLLKTMNIIAELLGVLNPNASPELAGGLSEIYRYSLELIGRGLRERDPAPLAEARRHLTTLADAWREIAQSAA